MVHFAGDWKRRRGISDATVQPHAGLKKIIIIKVESRFPTCSVFQNEPFIFGGSELSHPFSECESYP